MSVQKFVVGFAEYLRTWFRDPRYFYWLLNALVCFLFIATFRVGLVRGLDYTIGIESYGRLLFAVGATITEIDHQSRGYVISAGVEQALTQNGLTADDNILASFGTKFPDNLRNPQLIEAAIRTAIAHPGSAGPVRGASGDDLGMVDYVKLAFGLFGQRILSLYLTYFVLFGAGTTAFFLAYRDKPTNLVLLSIVMTGQLALFACDILDQVVHEIGSISDPRFMSVLAIIPGLHIALATVQGVPASRTNVVLVGIQAALLVFVCWIRAEAFWILLALCILSIALLVASRRRGKFQLGLQMCWGMAVVFLILGLHSIYASFALNSVYRHNGEVTHHLFWSSIFYSLQLHPQWDAKYGPGFENAKFDELPWVAAQKYVERHPPADTKDIYIPGSQHLNFSALETYSRKAFFEILERDPKFVLEVFFVYKPRDFSSALAQHTSSLRHAIDSPSWFVLGLALWVAVLGRLQTAGSLRSLTFGAMLLTGAFCVSAVPVLITVTYPNLVADQYLLLLAACGTWLIVLITAGVRSLSKTSRAPSG